MKALSRCAERASTSAHNEPDDTGIQAEDPGEVLPPDDPGDEFVPPDDPGDEFVPPDDPGDEFVPPDDPGDEFVPPDDPGDAVELPGVAEQSVGR